MELRGTLTDFSLEAILGLIHSGHKTGTLRLEAVTPLHMQRSIEVSFADGDVTGARCGTLQGLDALREAAVCAEGSFEFTIGAGLPAHEDGGMGSMDAVLGLIAETRARMTELVGKLPEAGTGFKHGMPEGDTIRLSAEEFRLVAVFREGMTIETMVSSSPAPTVESLRIIQQLRERGLLETGPAVHVVDQMAYAGYSLWPSTWVVRRAWRSSTAIFAQARPSRHGPGPFHRSVQPSRRLSGPTRPTRSSLACVR